MLISLANSVANAVNSADFGLINTDLGDPGLSNIYDRQSLLSRIGLTHHTSLATTHIAALCILLVVAMFRVLTFVSALPQQHHVGHNSGAKKPSSHTPYSENSHSTHQDDCNQSS